MNLAISLVLVVVFLLMNAFFVIAEFALVRVRPSQIELAVEEGKPGAKNAKIVADNVNAYLSACQLGITLASLALGWLGEPAFAKVIHPLFDLFGLPDAAVSAIAVAIGYFIMTTLHVVAGELIPKSFAIFSTERWALRTATPLIYFYKITYPIMVMFNGITNAVVKLSGHDPAKEHEVYTGEEIKLLIDESTESGLIDPEQNEYVDNIFDLGDKDAEAIMTPRTEMVCLDMEDDFEENLRLARKHQYTRYPVCDGSKDRIVGFVHVKDLYKMSEGGADGDLPVRDICAVPETIPAAKVLNIMQQRHDKIVVVVDEHGGTAGIVTLADVIEQIVGRVDDEYEHDNDDVVVKLADGTLLVDGSLAIDELEELVGFRTEEFDECETAAGLIMDVLDRIPEVGDIASLEQRGRKASFTVLDMDGHRVDKISITVEETETEEGEEDGE